MPARIDQLNIQRTILVLLACVMFGQIPGVVQAEAGSSLDADLELTLALSMETATVGDEVTITLIVYNHGPRSAHEVSVHYRLPEGLAFVATAFSDTADTYDPATGVWSIGTIAEDMLMPVPMMRLDVRARVLAAGTTEHIAEVTASSQPDPDSIPDNADPLEDDYASGVLVVEEEAEEVVVDLQLTLNDGGATAMPGEVLVYTLGYLIVGRATTDVVLTERLPAHTTFTTTGSAQGWVFTGGDQYELRLGDLEAGASGAVVFAVVVDEGIPEAVTHLTNTATLRDDGSQGPDATPEDNSATVETPLVRGDKADLSLALMVSDEAPLVGEEITLLVQIANAGPSEATGVEVEIALPEGLHLVSHDGGSAYDAFSELWVVGSLGAGMQHTLSFMVEVGVAGPLRIVAAISSVNQVDPDSVPGGSRSSEDDEAEAIVTGSFLEPLLTSPGEEAKVTSSQVDLLWEGVPGATSYEVEVAVSGSGFAEQVFARVVEELSVQVEELAGSTSYAWRVRAIAGDVVGPWSQVRTFIVEDNAVGIASRAVPGEAYRLSAAYPNPFSSQTSLHVSVAVAQEIVVEVFDALGRQVNVLYRGVLPAQTDWSVAWTAGNHPSGLYLIRVVGEHFVETRRVMLVK